MNKKQKILLITKHFPPEIDGVGDHSFQLATRLSKEGHELEIVTASIVDDRTFKCYYNKLNSLQSISSLKKTITKVNPNIIIFQYVPFSYNRKGLPFWLVPLFRYLSKQNLRIFLFVHETFERRRIKLKHILLEILQRLILFKLCTYSNHIFTNNMLYIQHLKKYKKKITLTPTPSNFEGIQYFRKEANSNKLNMVIFGDRNPDLILPLLLATYNLEKNTSIRFIGKISASTKSALETTPYNNLLDNIVFAGVLPAHEIIEEISLADFYILPEKVEGKIQMGGLSTKSGSTATAFMLGKVVVTTSGDMTDPIFKDMHNCMLLNLSDNKLNAIKIIELYHNSELKKKIEKNARLLYQEKLQWSNTTNCIEKVIHSS